MKMRMYAIYDSKGESFGNILFFPTKGVAIRSFQDECNRKESNINQHPEDFTLFELGSYEPRDGSFEIYDVKQSIGLAIEFKKTVE